MRSGNVYREKTPKKENMLVLMYDFERKNYG